MPYVVTEDCIKCKYTDCVETCPVDCFYEGENMLVINPSECIDCAACEPVCPINAIVPDTEPGGIHWLELNRKYSVLWPKLTHLREAPPNAKEWEQVPEKYRDHFSPNPATANEEQAV
jgi:ferredoxin